jgi:hypothetical protein
MENINSISTLFYSLDDETLIKMALHEGGKNLRDFCILLSVDAQIEKEIEKYKSNLVS